jgi:hypothetical protein
MNRGGLQQMQGRIGVSTEYIGSPAVGQDCIQLQERIVGGNEQVGSSRDAFYRLP